MPSTLNQSFIDQLSKSFINGEWVDGESGKEYKIQDPYDGSTVSTVTVASRAQIIDAYEAAKEAQKEWKKTSADERREVLTKALQYLKDHQAEIEKLIVRETGGTGLKAAVEFGFGIGDIEDALPMVDEIYQPKDYSSNTPNKVNRVYRLPLGVITSITPFNFPFNMATRTIFPALALGNAVVHKPDIQVGLVGGQIFAKAFEKAGLPAGVFNSILTDVEEAEDEFIINENSDFISFTGSTVVGKHIKQRTGTSMKEVALELGGNNPLIILEDADIDQAVKIATFGKFMHNGQICAITNRIIVHENVYDEFVEKYVARVKALKVGDPKDPDTVIGPLINATQADKVMGLIDQAKKEGLTIALEGKRDGNVISPYVFTNVSNDSTLASTEIFGPVAQIIPAKSDEEAIQIANDTEFGLSAAILTSDAAKGERLALEIDSGTAHVNDVPSVLESHVPFGGTKNSGIGRFGHEWTLEEFTVTKWISVQNEKLDYPF